MLARHGTQYPSSRDAFRMKDRLPKLRKTILQNHKERRGWSIEILYSALRNCRFILRGFSFLLMTFFDEYRNALPTGYRWTQQ